MKKHILLIAMILLLAPAPCLAGADVSVSLTLDRLEATPVDSIQMIVSITGTGDSDSKPVLQGLQNFNVTRGGTSRRMEIINGKVRAGTDYTYFIQPKKIGTFRIGPAEVRLEGKTIGSNTETIKIVKPTQARGVDRSPLFLRATISAPKVYVEQQAIYTLKLYRRARVRDISLSLPQTEHITLKQLGRPREYRSVHDGQNYQVLEVRYALVPAREGHYTVAPSIMKMTVFQPGRKSPQSRFIDPFSDNPLSFFSTGRPIEVAGEALELKVLPLPTEGKPSDFTGLVGSFKIESKLEPSTVKTGEAATLTVILSGRGNVNRIPDLKVPEVDHTRRYADQPVLDVTTDTKGIAGSKIMKWALVPDKEGSYRIPALSVSFFDTVSRQYRKIETSPHTLSVLPGQEKKTQSGDIRAAQPGTNGPLKAPVKELARDILPVHTSMKDFLAVSPTRSQGLLFPLLLFMPAFTYALALFIMRFRRKSRAASALTKAKKAAGVFSKQSKNGKLSAGDLTLSIRDYLNARFGLALGTVTPDEAAEILKSKGVNSDTAAKLQAILIRLENTVYTGKEHEPLEAGDDLPKLIKQIEEEIP